MLNGKSVLIFFAVLVVAGVAHISRNDASAEMSGMQSHHQDMQHAHAVSSEDIIADITTEPEQITVGTQTRIVFSIKDRDGKPIEELSIHHDRILHVVVASQDFSVFAHIHPEDFEALTPEIKKTARYPVMFSFPKAGRYIIGIDFAVKGQLVSRHFLVHVTGEPKMGPPARDFSREKTFGGLEVTFASAPERIAAGEEVVLSYLFRKNGKPVDDLEPYLSAPMHLAIISTDLSRFIHTHGELPGMTGMGHHGHHGEMHMAVPDRFGPNIEVRVEFPAKGLYQIFGQVKHGDKVIDTSFMVEVE